MSEKLIPLDLIDVPTRLRPIDPSVVEMLAASFEESGHKQPILVRPKGERFELVAGGHRHGAATLLHWKAIRANIEDLDDNQARLAEIDENLMRRELNPLDRAVFLLERKKVYEELYPETKHGGARKSKTERLKDGREGKSPEWRLELFPARFTADAAEKVGLGERSVQRSIAIAEALSPRAIEAIRGTPLETSLTSLLALSQEAPGNQIKIVKSIASQEARSISEARVKLGLAEAVVRDPQARAQAQLMAAWESANKRTRKAFIEHIKDDLAALLK